LKTPLIIATISQKIKSMEMLLSHKAKPNLKDSKGKAAVHYAAESYYFLIMETLLKYTSLIDEIDDKSESSIVIASRLHRNCGVVDVISQNYKNLKKVNVKKALEHVEKKCKKCVRSLDNANHKIDCQKACKITIVYLIIYSNFLLILYMYWLYFKN